MNDVPEKVIGRIRKMLALANDRAATEGERDNAMRMAHATLAKYNLDLAQVEAAGKTSAGDSRVQEVKTLYGRPWARTVCASIAELFFCRNLYMPAKKATDTQHIFIGRKANAATAAEMSAYVVESIRKEARRRARSLGVGNTWVRSFCIGAATAVHAKAKALRRESEQTAVPAASSGKEIVLASVYAQEKEANDRFVAETYQTLRTGQQGKRTGDMSAVEAGKNYGATISLNRQVGGTSSTPKRLHN